MPSKRKPILIITVAALAIGFFALRPKPVSSQTADPATLLAQCVDLQEASSFDQALTQLASLSQQFPETDYDLEARQMSAQIYGTLYEDVVTAGNIEQSIITDFPYTPERFYAGVNLADIQLIHEGGSLQDFIASLEVLVQNAGGPSIAHILAGEQDLHVSPRPPFSTVQQMTILEELYSHAAGRYRGRPATEMTDTLLRNSLTLQLFLIRNSAAYVNEEIFLNTHETALRRNVSRGLRQSLPEFSVVVLSRAALGGG